MKNLLTFLFVLFSYFVFSQEQCKPDTNQICFPSKVGKQILLDLNELDNLRKLKILTEQEISNLEQKVVAQDTIISKLEQKDVYSQIIIESVKEKYNLVEEDNKDLRKKIKRTELKSTIIEIVSGAVLTTITLLQIFK
jgi:hypothetical protein